MSYLAEDKKGLCILNSTSTAIFHCDQILLWADGSQVEIMKDKM